MKKTLLYFTMLVFGAMIFASCEKEEVGATEAVAMAGEWYVTVVCVDADGNVVYEDDEFFGLGHFHLDTYNTSENNTNEMWIDDNGNFWAFKNKINTDFDMMSFQAPDAQNVAYDCLVNITNGKITYDAATTPSGMPADSIQFNVTFSDDTYPEQYGFAAYRIAGYRYTGFTNDN